MASVGPGRYVVVVIHVGGTKLSNVKLILQREPRTGKTWFPTGSLTANEEHVDAAVRELREGTGLILTLHDLMLLSDAHVRVALPGGQQLVYIYSAYVPVQYVTNHLSNTYSSSARAGCYIPVDDLSRWYLRRPGNT
jgi:ADP-ribose pyrophosphatase YjhB (NUDIX family)